ncbi:MAG: cellulose-binding protein, partial [Cyanobacteria bacterium]|nr:cellulose-binding protein [Cyanobacteria bacterium GSL.Bin21]
MIKLRKSFLIFTVTLSLVLITSLLIKGLNSFQRTAKNTNNEIHLSSQSKTETNIGTNLHGINEWSSQLPFLDGFRSSRPWLPQQPGVWNTRENDQLDLDANGWVKSLPSPEDGAARLSSPKSEYTHVGTLLFRGLAGNYSGGEYLVLYEGEGTIEYDFDATLDPVASGPGRDVITVNPSGAGIYLRITETDPNQTGNYLRNLRVVPTALEDSYPTEIFNPAFIEKIQSFPAFRFMDWMKTNNSTQKEWSNRPTLEDAT